MSKRQRQRQCNRNNLGLSEVEVGGNLRSFWQSQVLCLLKPRTAELIEPTPTKKSRNRSERQNKRGCQQKWHTWPPIAGSAWLNRLCGRCAPAKCIFQIFAPDFSFFLTFFPLCMRGVSLLGSCRGSGCCGRRGL